LASKIPSDFQFALKVTDEITVKKFTNLPRFGMRAGKPNENFLNADLFASAFVKPCEPFRGNVGLLMFEFSKFYPTDYQHGRYFAADLDRFLEQLPKGWPYGVEVRSVNRAQQINSVVRVGRGTGWVAGLAEQVGCQPQTLGVG
jgi:uncharacterized protein YecE (DUF72 family)